MRITRRLVRALLVAGSLALVAYAVVNGGLHGWASGDVLNPLLVGVLVLGEYVVTRAGRERPAQAERPPHAGPAKRARISGRPRRATCRPAGRRDSARNRGSLNRTEATRS